MAKGKRSLLKILAAVVGALLVLIVVALLLLPRFINMEGVRGKILARVSQQVRGQVDFHRMDFRLFPSIKVVIHGGRVRIPSTLDVSANTLRVDIRFFPLLRGRVEPTSIAIEEVKGWVRLRSGGEGRKGSSLSMEEKVKAFLTLLSSKTPGLKITLKGANLVLYRGGGEKGLPLSGVEAKISLPPGRLKLSVSMTSSVVSSLKVGGWLEPEDLKGELDVDLGGFQLHKLLHWLSLSFPMEPTDSLVNLSVSMEFQGLREVKGRLKGSVPRLLLKGQKGIPAIECRSFNAGFSKIGSAWQVILKELALAHPGIRLSGRFFMDSAGESVSLTLKGESVDVSSVRKVALFLAGSHPTVEKIFHIVRAGEVPSIVFEDRASSPKGLGKLENMVIRGSIKNGIIVVPKELLTIKDVGGRVFISKGFLNGEGLVGRLGNSRILSGTLRLGLRGKDFPLHLEADVDADLSQLPGILKRVLKGGVLLSEINRMKDVKGRALGRLVLAETTRVERVEVEARSLKLSCLYDRVPYPIRIEGGGFSYKGSRIRVMGLKGSLGKSAFGNLSAWIDWGSEQKGVGLNKSQHSPGLYLKVSSMAGELVLDEIYPWITSYRDVKEALGDFPFMKGLLWIETLTLEGSPLQPAQWKFKMVGKVKGFSMGFTLFPAPLQMDTGKVSITPQRLAFRDCIVRLLDASARVSGGLEGYMRGVDRLELSMDGRFGPKAADWVYRFINLPQEYRFKSPLALKGAQLLWERKGRTDFSGLVEVGSAKADVDLEVLGDLLLIRKLNLTGAGSSAHIGLTLRGRALSINFSGTLNREVLDLLLEKNTLLKGWVKGDFAAHIALDKVADFSAKGNLDVKGLTCLWGVRMPLGIDEASVEACGTALEVKKAFLSLKHSSLAVEGKVELVEDRLHMDLDLSSSSLDVKEIEELFGKEDEREPKGKWDLPIGGEVRARIFSLFYGDYTWSPVKARVLLSPNQVKVVVEKALICGIATPGTITFLPGKITMKIKVRARKRDFGSTLYCLFDEERLAQGTFSLKGYLTARGKEDPLSEDSTGEFHLKAGKGRVYRLTLISKIFAVLNVTDIFRGKLPDLAKEGFAYSSMKMKAHFKNGVLLVDEGIINGDSMRIFADGRVDFVKERLNLTVLVAPFKTLDTVVSHIPLLGRVLTGKSRTLVSFPVRVTGKLADPTVIPLSPTAVGSGLLGIMKRTIEMPVRIIAPPVKKGD